MAVAEVGMASAAVDMPSVAVGMLPVAVTTLSSDVGTKRQNGAPQLGPPFATAIPARLTTRTRRAGVRCLKSMLRVLLIRQVDRVVICVLLTAGVSLLMVEEFVDVVVKCFDGVRRSERVSYRRGGARKFTLVHLHRGTSADVDYALSIGEAREHIHYVH